jgi:hypothetical protein
MVGANLYSSASCMTLVQVQPILDTWQPASWEEFVRLADDPQADKLKCYYYDGKMRFEAMSTGADHSKDHALIIFALSFFAATQGINAKVAGFTRFAVCGFGTGVGAEPGGKSVSYFGLVDAAVSGVRWCYGCSKRKFSQVNAGGVFCLGGGATIAA